MNEQELRSLGVRRLLAVLKVQVEMAAEMVDITRKIEEPDLAKDGPLIVVGDFVIYARERSPAPFDWGRYAHELTKPNPCCEDPTTPGHVVPPAP